MHFVSILSVRCSAAPLPSAPSSGGAGAGSGAPAGSSGGSAEAAVSVAGSGGSSAAGGGGGSSAAGGGGSSSAAGGGGGSSAAAAGSGGSAAPRRLHFPCSCIYRDSSSLQTLHREKNASNHLLIFNDLLLTFCYRMFTFRYRNVNRMLVTNHCKINK